MHLAAHCLQGEAHSCWKRARAADLRVPLLQRGKNSRKYFSTHIFREVLKINWRILENYGKRTDNEEVRARVHSAPKLCPLCRAG